MIHLWHKKRLNLDCNTENNYLFLVVLNFKTRDVLRKDKCADIMCAKRQFDVYAKQYA